VLTPTLAPHRSVDHTVGTPKYRVRWQLRSLWGGRLCRWCHEARSNSSTPSTRSRARAHGTSGRPWHQRVRPASTATTHNTFPTRSDGARQPRFARRQDYARRQTGPYPMCNMISGGRCPAGRPSPPVHYRLATDRKLAAASLPPTCGRPMFRPPAPESRQHVLRASRWSGVRTAAALPAHRQDTGNDGADEHPCHRAVVLDAPQCNSAGIPDIR